jgi:hypothetical protein
VSHQTSSTNPLRPKKKKLSKSEAVHDVSRKRDQVFNEPPGPTCNQLDDVTCNNNGVEPPLHQNYQFFRLLSPFSSCGPTVIDGLISPESVRMAHFPTRFRHGYPSPLRQSNVNVTRIRPGFDSSHLITPQNFQDSSTCDSSDLAPHGAVATFFNLKI